MQDPTSEWLRRSRQEKGTRSSCKAAAENEHQAGEDLWSYQSKLPLAIVSHGASLKPSAKVPVGDAGSRVGSHWTGYFKYKI